MKETAADRKYSREIEEKPKRTVGIDEPFVVLILLLLLIGLVCLYSASYVVGYYSTDPGVTSATYVKKQGRKSRESKEEGHIEKSRGKSPASPRKRDI